MGPVILCIDDEELGLEVRRMVLERGGYTVLAARDGASGIAMFEQHHVDAVVLDYAMPGMNGGEVAALLRERRPEVPIVLLSAYVALPDQVIGLVDLSLTKGDGAAALLTRLQELLQSHAALRGEADSGGPA